jgi:hypothetical protein
MHRIGRRRGMVDAADNSLSLEGEGRVRVFDDRTCPRPGHPLTSSKIEPSPNGPIFELLSPQGRGGPK